MDHIPAQEFIKRRVDLLVGGKTDQMVDNDYTDDALLVDLNFQVRGKDALKKHFAEHIPMMGGLELKSVGRVAETDDTIFFEVTVKTGKWGEVTTCEGFHFKGGKADYHFTTIYPAAQG